MCHLIEKHFILVILILSTFSIVYPSIFIDLKPYIPLLLGIIIFCIGATLNPKDITSEWKNFRIIGFIIFAKYILISLVTLAISKLFRLSINDTIGLIIIGACPGGTAANVMSYLSHSNTAVTILLTLVSTLVAPVVTTLLIYVFLHKYINFPMSQIFHSIVVVLFFPLIAGLIFKRITKKSYSLLPSLSIISIALIVSCIVALNRNSILLFPINVIGAVISTNLAGYVIGYFLGGFFWKRKESRRAIAFEFGIQDTALGTMIAISFFNPATALVAALFSIIQNMTGSMLVRAWKPRESSNPQQNTIYIK